MSTLKGLAALDEQKQLLILQADVHRALLRVEWASVRERLDFVSEARANLTRHPWLIAGGTVAGLLAAKRWGGLLKWIPSALSAWRLLGKLRAG